MIHISAVLTFLAALVLATTMTFFVCRVHFRKHLSHVCDAQVNQLRNVIRGFEDRHHAALSDLDRAHSNQLQEATQATEVAVLTARAELVEQHGKALRELEEAFQLRLKESAAAVLSVTVYPFVSTGKEKGWFNRETAVEIGYRYQLLVQGVPCFEPHIVVTDKTREKKLDEAAIEVLKTRAIQLAEAATQVKGGGVPRVLCTVAKTVVQPLK